MLTIRKAQDRGVADHGWLKSRHTFSFGEYYDSKHMGFRSLRVINEDRVAGGMGFDAHPHHDMEIISYVLTGSLEHQDSMGNKTVIKPNEVQVMSAGTGVKHAEYNHSASDETHFFQIWIQPKEKGLAPSYAQKSFKQSFLDQNLVLVASSDAREGSNLIHQDADVYIGKFKQDQKKTFEIRPGRHVWIQVIKGDLKVNKIMLIDGDGLAISDETTLQLTASLACEFLLFDLS